MAKYGSDDIFLIIDGDRLDTFLTEFTLDGPEAVLEETHTFGDSWVEQEGVGLRRFSMQMTGFYSDAANESKNAFEGQEGSQRVMCWGVEGNLVGVAFDGIEATVQAMHSHRPQRGELQKVAASYMGSGVYETGVILHERVAENTDGDTEANSVDNGAATTNGGAAYLQTTFLSLGGFTSVTITVRHSADDAVYADLATFPDVTMSRTAERITLPDTINQFLAVSWTFNGTGSSPVATFMVGAVRN